MTEQPGLAFAEVPFQHRLPLPVGTALPPLLSGVLVNGVHRPGAARTFLNALWLESSVGDQRQPKLLAINPDGRTPVIVDAEAGVSIAGAILIYLAETHGMLLPAGGVEPKDPAAAQSNRPCPSL